MVELSKQQLIELLHAINNRLKVKEIKGEVGLYGGAVMCVALNARLSTHDIDAIFNPKYDVRQAAKEVGLEYGLQDGWFNDAVKGFISAKNELLLFEQLSNLTIYVASPRYMFAMKVLSLRLDNENEINDIKFLIDFLELKSVVQAESIIYEFYPPNRVLPKTFYFLEEFLGG